VLGRYFGINEFGISVPLLLEDLIRKSRELSNLSVHMVILAIIFSIHENLEFSKLDIIISLHSIHNCQFFHDS